MGNSPLRARAVALAFILSTGTAFAAERVHMPFDCTFAGGRVRLLPTGGDRSYAVVGSHDRQVFTTCSPAEPENCRNWLVHRFAFECDGTHVTWLEAAGSAARGENWDAWVEAGRFTMRMNRDWAVAPARPRRGAWRGRFAVNPGFNVDGRDDFEDRAPFGKYPYDEDHVISLPPGFAPVMGIPLTFTGGADAPVALGSDPSKANGWAPETHDTYAPPLGAAGPDGATAATNPAPSTPALPERAPPRKAAPATAQTSKEAPKATAAVPAAPASKAPAAVSVPATAGAPAEQGDGAPLLGKAEPLAGPATSPAPATGAASGTSAAAGTSSGLGTSLEPKILNAPAASAPAPAPAPAQAASSSSSKSAPSAVATTAQPQPVTAQPTTGQSAPSPIAPLASIGTGSERQTAGAGVEAGAPAPETTALPTAAVPHSRDVLSGSLASGVAAALLAVLSLSAFTLWRRVRATAAVAGTRDISSITLDRAPKPVVPVRPAGTAAGATPAAEKPVVPSFAASEEFPVPTSYEQALKVLGAAPDASAAALKKIVDGMRQSWHPDHASSEADRLYRERRLRQINVAWDLISKKGSAAA